MNRFEKLSALYAETKSQYERLNALQSSFDKAVANLYHELEKAGELGVETGHKFAKELQEILKRRRVVKQEIALLMPVYMALKDQMQKIEEHYVKASRKHFEIKQSLNVTMEISEVLEMVEA